MKKTITQYVVQTTTKLSGWGWESYFKTELEAKRVYESRKQNKDFATVTMRKETFSKPGGPMKVSGIAL